MKQKNIYDLIGIGIGPYNLGLAALIDEQDILDAIFFEQNATFQWHPGMLIERTDLQVPFLADLVTLANPKSHYSFLNYLHTQNRLYPFYFFHRFEIPRKEYDAYARWVIEQLSSCHLKSEVVDVIDHQDHFEVKVKHWDKDEVKSYLAKHVVMGTGSKPATPSGTNGLPLEDIHHTSQYLFHKERTQKAKSITIIGSGQSAAEVFYDLLKEQDYYDYHLTWLTRSTGLLQLDASKIGQEVFSPDYVDYFHDLPFDQRIEALDKLGQLRKGIDAITLHKIYEWLYHKSVDGNKLEITIQPLTELNNIERKDTDYQLVCNQWQEGSTFTFTSEKVILATGYKPNIPDWFLERFSKRIAWEDEKRYQVTRDYRLVFHEEVDRSNHFFTLTNLEHSHGSGATNLALAVDRNVHIINKIAGQEIYRAKQDTLFTQFTKK
ncbi:lysine 6-monooxygenase [Paraliobacillus quinghaiensis]|uniref:L-lysine N6-monooxygenase MbtG n=1 Tax=Paraliobacillus quinghaiensis TaxID=470815 RepID=A0A917TE37_9BACI|nr:SidA/IucD/PvdA family monooxygenase [Paraliobacillus quinghaiensis]GGM19540.1 lysine 6-monooxygenase [Paraliobacillus quinghaiensis]